jgi:hypothetical protein
LKTNNSTSSISKHLNPKSDENLIKIVSIKKYKQNTIEASKNGSGYGKSPNLLIVSKIKDKTTTAVFDFSKYKLCLIDSPSEMKAKRRIQ